MLSIEELSFLQEELMKQLPAKIFEIVTRLNRTGDLEQLLQLLGMQELLGKNQRIESYKDGQIVVIGASNVSETKLAYAAQSLGISKDRLEFCLDYDKIEKYNFRKLQNAPQYRVVLFGPCPHSGHGKGNSASIISEIENNNSYPKAVCLVNGGELHISVTNFKRTLHGLIEEGYIRIG